MRPSESQNISVTEISFDEEEQGKETMVGSVWQCQQTHLR